MLGSITVAVLAFVLLQKGVEDGDTRKKATTLAKCLNHAKSLAEQGNPESALPALLTAFDILQSSEQKAQPLERVNHHWVASNVAFQMYDFLCTYSTLCCLPLTHPHFSP